MTMFGLKEAEVAGLIRPVLGDTADRESIELAFARAAWSGIAEPGDGDAGAVVDALGPAAALTALLEKVDADRLGKDTGVEAARLRVALDRWWPKVSSTATMLALKQASRFAVRLRMPEGSDWPAQLLDLGPHAPLALWTRGSDKALASLDESIAIVGARAATGYGEHVAAELGAGAVDRGFAVVSGAAYGIDGVAHRAALASEGFTIAFLAGGVDRFYPSGHDALLTRIVDRGLVVSELPCGFSPTKWRFLQRNRLIAAASQATVVVEAGHRSGSLNTAHHAADLGRALGAVPGPVTSPASAGCHRLLREGFAVCVTTPDELAELVRPPLADPAGEPYDPDALRVLDALSARSGRTALEIAARSGLSEATVTAVLGRLELEQRVQRLLDGWRRG